MDRLLKAKRLCFFAALFSTLLIPVAIGLCIIFIQKLLYLPLALTLVVALYAIYSAPFYFRAHYERVLWLKINEMKVDMDNTDAIAAKLSLNPKFVKKSLDKALVKGYFVLPQCSKKSTLNEKETVKE